MAYVLSLMPHSPLAAPYQERRYERSWSSLGSNGTVQRHRNRQHSTGSLASAASLHATSQYPADRHTPVRSISYSDLVVARPLSQRASSATSRLVTVSTASSLDDAPKQSTSTELLPNRKASTPGRNDASLLDLVDEEDADTNDELDLGHALSWHTGEEKMVFEDALTVPGLTLPVFRTDISSRHFQRWLSVLRRRKAKRTPFSDEVYQPAASSTRLLFPERHCSVRNHRKSESWASSLDFVTAVKSASITIASFGAGTMSRSGTRKSGRSRRWRESGGSDVRKSVDSTAPSLGAILDEAAQQRSRKRREKLEELIRTEESYLADLKALSNAYFTLLPPLLPHTAHTRTSARSNLANMIQLHDEILGELHNVVPLSDVDSTTAAETATKARPTHARWLSDDGASPRRPRQGFGHAGWSKRRSLDAKMALEPDCVVLPCSTATVSDVAKVFARNMKRFTLYEEYGARCEMMQEDVDFFQKTTLSGPDYDKAIEALCASLNPLNTREANKRKALGLKDLLIKPVQRITRYELLFRDLCTYTPSCDDPSSHVLLEDVLFQFSEVCHNVNLAKDNPQRLRVLENSWLLQDRLFFQDKISRSLLFQRLGRLSLCGTLHVVYRTKDQIQGKYIACMMYESCLTVANVENVGRYNVILAASLATASIEATDNGKGLQCHTAPYTWKLVFESSGKMYEVIFSACSAVEESIWKNEIAQRIAVESRHLAEAQVLPLELCSPLTKDLRSVGKVYGKSGGFVRRLSIHRTATLGPLSELNQVIIKHTQAPRDESVNSSSSSLPIPRSQSVSTPSHIPTLAPMRQERIKLETMLADVWTRDAIPYPGMGTRRSELSIRDTANDLIRKLSMASIASNFSKRSMSYTAASGSYNTNGKPPKPKKTKPAASRPKRPPLIDFQNAPDAFLPVDFELQDPRSRPVRGLGLRTFTMTGCDRPRSPFFFSQENRAPDIQRSESVPQQEESDMCSSQGSSTEGTLRGKGVASRQSTRENTGKPSAREGGKTARLMKFLGKARPYDD